MTPEGCPSVTLKLATSLDGRIATAAGESRWITGEAAREEVHRLRAAHDAVLVGSQTVIDDDPELTVRLPGYDGPQPLRVVADARLRTSPSARLFAASAEGGLAVIATSDEWGEAELLARGGAAALVQAPAAEGGRGLSPPHLIDAIGRLLPPRASLSGSPGGAILLEGGGELAASFLRENLVDRIEWFRAPIVLGGDARPAVAALELGALADAPRFRRVAVREVGDDLWETYVQSDASDPGRAP